MKVIFVGDPHLDSRTPLSRKDDYEQVTLNKLSKIKDIAIKHKVDHIIFSGDMFDKDKYDQPLSYINSVIAKFNDFKEEGIEVWSIIGNHDLRHNKMEYFKNSPLNILVQAGVVKLLDKEDINNKYVFYGINFTEADKIDTFIENLDKTKTNVLIMHYATDNTVPGDSISRSKIKNFDIVLSGHDHMPYKTEKDGKMTLFRPGSMIRRTKDKYNLDRIPIVYVYDFILNKAIEEKLTEDEPSVVFKEDVFIDSLAGLNNSDVIKLFNDNYFKREDLSLGEMIKSLPLPITEKTKKELLNYINSLGLE